MQLCILVQGTCLNRERFGEEHIATKYMMINVLSITEHENSLQWRQNEHDGLSNHQPHDCLLNHSFMCRSKTTSKIRVTGICAGNSPVTGEFPAQRDNNAENIFIWWRHHVTHDILTFALSSSSKIYNWIDKNVWLVWDTYPMKSLMTDWGTFIITLWSPRWLYIGLNPASTWPGYLASTRSITWLLVRATPSHRQPWRWLSFLNRSLYTEMYVFQSSQVLQMIVLQITNFMSH